MDRWMNDGNTKWVLTKTTAKIKKRQMNLIIKNLVANLFIWLLYFAYLLHSEIIIISFKTIRNQSFEAFRLMLCTFMTRVGYFWRDSPSPVSIICINKTKMRVKYFRSIFPLSCILSWSIYAHGRKEMKRVQCVQISPSGKGLMYLRSYKLNHKSEWFVQTQLNYQV